MVIIDLGSQYTLIIERELKKIGLRSIILPPEKALAYVTAQPPLGIILSGGSASVHDADAPQLPKELLYQGIPILGICYGMQWIAHMLAPHSVSGNHVSNKEYGPTEITHNGSALFADVASPLSVWASHGDSVTCTPYGFFKTAASNEDTTIQAISYFARPIYGVQFHPEVIETKDDNQILKNFAYAICKCENDWSDTDTLIEIENQLREQIGTDTAILGVSGGVDSMVVAAIAAKVLGDRLHAFLIDGGNMREGEVAETQKIAAEIGISLTVIDARDRFIQLISQTIDAEQKRAYFKKVYQEIFMEQIENSGAKFVLQGTLATDLIESGSAGGSAHIKSHHNVGLKFGLEEITPLKNLFKHEVRELARMLGLPDSIAQRQPFPGPGLFIRVIGTPVSAENLEMVRFADAVVKDILTQHGVYNQISQTVVVLIGTNTVGIKGDGRVYGPSIAIRTVSTTDFMTVDSFEIPFAIRRELISTITKHPGIIRVWFDETPKPPATTEFE